jgi:hypothetical protein
MLPQILVVAAVVVQVVLEMALEALAVLALLSCLTPF